MDEQRIAAYLNLIQQLLKCPNGEEGDILNANRELVDADFVQVVEVVAADRAAKGDTNAGWWQNLAAHLANYIDNTATPEEYFNFLMEVLQATSDSGGEPQVVYRILQQNIEKLNLRFAEKLQAWATSTFTEVTLEQANSIAGVIGELGNLIQQFPLGRRAWNLEIAIACYKSALKVRTRENYPEKWAMTQNNLGVAYSDRREGVRAANMESAISCYRSALEVYTRENYPEDWAATQNNLGAAYRDRREEVRAANIELAISCYRSALEVYTRENYPKKWAGTQNNLGAAYSHRIEGGRAANIESAISCYRSALEVYTRENYPEKWARIQNNLGTAYNHRIEGVRAANIESAIACYRSALEVYTRKNYPEDWAAIQNNLGAAYRNRIEGVRATNIELAISCYRSALEVYTRENYPEKWAGIQNNLGAAYSDRIEEDRAANIESAIACYRSALEVYTRENYPEDWGMTQNNLGAAYRDRREEVRAANIELAISCYRSPLEVRTRENYPEDWAGTQNNLGTAYRDRIEGVRATNIESAISCYRSAFKVYTRENYPEKWARTQNNLGTAYSDRIEGVRAANIESAIACYRSALEVYTPTAFPLECLTASRNLGNTAFTAGFWEIGIEGYEQAMTAVEYSRSWATSDDRRQQMVAESIDVYENAIQACVNSGQLEKAIEYCDRTRSKHLVDLMHSNDLYASGEIPPEVQTYLREFEAKQQEIDAEVEQLRNPSSGNKELASVGSQSRSRADVVAYTEKIAQLESEKQQIWQNIRRLDPVLAGQLQVDGMKFAAMQQLIENPYTAILCFYTTDDDTHVFVIYKDKAPQVHTCQGEGWATFQKWIQESWLLPYLRDQKSWQQGMGEFLSQLSQRLKVEDLIGKYLDGIEELIVIPHLFLHQIPLAALPINPPQPPLSKGGLREEPDSLLVDESIDPPQPPLAKGGLREEPNSLLVDESIDPPQPPLAKGGLREELDSLLVDESIDPPQPPLAKGGLREEPDSLLVEGHLTEEQSPPLSKGESLPSPLLSKGETLPSPPLSKGGPGGVLSDYFLIRYVPSCKILEYCHQRRTIESPQYGIVENATDDLYFTPFECQEINKIVPVKQHLKGRKQATVANYRNLVKTVNILHSSHHANSRLDNPLASELLLGNGSITLGELMTPGWRLPDLSDVFLSCCETNLGMTTITDDILTLGTGFLCAGARSVVSTLWAVDDLATSLFSIFYYQYRQQVGCSRPDALRRAQVRLRTISGAELEVMYKSQIDAIIPLIIENLKLKLVEVQAEKEKLTAQEKKYNRGTAEYKELHKQTREKTKEEAKICEKIKGYETLRQNLYKMPNPFADLIYWSGFICQGLH